MRKNIALLFALFFSFLFQNCSDNDGIKPIEEGDKDLAAKWADVTLNTVQFSPSNTPTYTSRSLGYIGVTMYESVVNGSTTRKSLVAQLNGLNQLPQPQAGQEYSWALSLNAGQATILKSLYPHANSGVVAVIDSLEAATYKQEILNTTNEVAQRSVLLGKAIAEAIYEWSKTDGGHEGYLHNFDPSYVVPEGDGYWIAPTFGQSVSKLPLHPYWGNNRTFVSSNAALPVAPIVPYSNTSNSDYYKLFEEVYAKRNSLTEEEKRIAAWWADDPTESPSPPGHSYNLATIAVTSANADLFEAAEAYAKVGMAVGDAFICCWKNKYTYHSQRPLPFIRANIDDKYEQFWPEPPFPAFSSGHATQSAAAATALISIFGNNFPMIDNTYENRPPGFYSIPFRSRRFSNLWATATECAYSRFLGGIHTRLDNETGTEQGKEIGENVAGLSWEK